MIVILQLLLATIMTWFTASVYSDIPSSGGVMIVLFLAWNIVFWLLSYFYHNKTFYKVPQILGLVIFYIKELIIASIRVAYDVLTPKKLMKPAVIALPLEAKTDLEITLLANFITLTPGTLSIDLSKDRKTLFIHEVYVSSGDVDRVKKQIKEGFEKKILKITRA